MVPMGIKELKTGFFASLVLQEDRGERFLPVRLNGTSARKMQEAMTTGGRRPTGMQDLLANTLKFMDGSLSRVELRDDGRGRVLARLIIDQGGKEVRFPARLIDALLLARGHSVPILVEEATLRRMGLRTDETGAQAAGAEWVEAHRLLVGFSALDRVDDALVACRRLRELAPESESWCVTLGELYARKGYRMAAARELIKGLAWYAREGYTTSAVEIGRQLAPLKVEALAEVTLKAPSVIEDFTGSESNTEWWGNGTVIAAPDRPEGKAYRPDPSRTWFILALSGGQIWEGAKAITVDIHVAPHPGRDLHIVAFGLTLGGDREGFYRSPSIQLEPGWNTIDMHFDEAWTQVEPASEEDPHLDGPVLGPVLNVQILFERPAGDVAFANFRLE